jgi:hypothetical protein
MIRWELPRTPVGIVYVSALAGSLVVALLLGGALWAKASARPVVCLVTGNDDPKVVTPGVIPDALARDYARDFFVTLETYLPSTVERQLAFLSGRIAPGGFHEFARFASNLKRLVRESRQASQLFVQDPESGVVIRDGRRIEVVLRGIRRISVDGAQLQEARLVYRVALVAGEPVRENPTGLLVAGFTYKVEPLEASHGK